MDWAEAIIVYGLSLAAVLTAGVAAHRARLHERGRARVVRSVGMGAGFVGAILTLIHLTSWTEDRLDSACAYLYGNWWSSYQSGWSYGPALVGVVATFALAQYATMRWDWRYGGCMLAMGVCAMVVHPAYTVSMTYEALTREAMLPIWTPPLLPLTTLVLAVRLGYQSHRSRWCVGCGYDLIGSVGKAPCPECGRSYAMATRLRGKRWWLDLGTLARGAAGWAGGAGLIAVGPWFAHWVVTWSHRRKFNWDEVGFSSLRNGEFVINTTTQLIWPCVLVALLLPFAAQFRVVKWWAGVFVLAVTVTVLWWGLAR